MVNAKAMISSLTSVEKENPEGKLNFCSFCGVTCETNMCQREDDSCQSLENQVTSYPG